MPLTAIAKRLLRPKCRARAGASSKIKPMRTPVRDVLPDSQEDAWVRVGDGWLTGRASPESEEELKSWGADVVESLYCTGEGGGFAHEIVAAAASAQALAHHYVCPLRNVCRGHYTDDDCLHLARAVVIIDAHLQRGHKVVVQGRHGKRRTAMAIYVVLCLNVETHADALSMMKAMRRAMFVRENKHGSLFDIVERAVANPAFVCEFVHSRNACIGDQSWLRLHQATHFATE